jgi:hypothetical protein
MQAFDTPQGRCLLANNGAAGMPNFSNLRQGLVTRISASAASDALYGTTVEGVRVEALPVVYDHAAFEREFVSTWPAGSPAHVSYHQRIVAGPSYRPADAVRLQAPVTA